MLGVKGSHLKVNNNQLVIHESLILLRGLIYFFNCNKILKFMIKIIVNLPSETFWHTQRFESGNKIWHFLKLIFFTLTQHHHSLAMTSKG